VAESGWLPGPQLRVTINGTVETILTTPDGVSLWTETFGEPGQPALLLVMGAMNQGIFWPDAFCQQLADAGHFVIRYDHRDTGRSSKVGRWPPYTLKALARDALAVLQGLGVAVPRWWASRWAVSSASGWRCSTRSGWSGWC